MATVPKNAGPMGLVNEVYDVMRIFSEARECIVDEQIRAVSVKWRGREYLILVRKAPRECGGILK